MSFFRGVAGLNGCHFPAVDSAERLKLCKALPLIVGSAKYVASFGGVLAPRSLGEFKPSVYLSGGVGLRSGECQDFGAATETGRGIA